VENKRSKIDDVGNEVILTSLKNGPTLWGHFTVANSYLRKNE
jgi:hypothetical protein